MIYMQIKLFHSQTMTSPNECITHAWPMSSHLSDAILVWNLRCVVFSASWSLLSTAWVVRHPSGLPISTWNSDKMKPHDRIHFAHFGRHTSQRSRNIVWSLFLPEGKVDLNMFWERLILICYGVHKFSSSNGLQTMFRDRCEVCLPRCAKCVRSCVLHLVRISCWNGKPRRKPHNPGGG